MNIICLNFVMELNYPRIKSYALRTVECEKGKYRGTIAVCDGCRTIGFYWKDVQTRYI